MSNILDNQKNWNSGFGNYVIAGGDCVASLFSNFFAKHNSDKVFDEDQFKTFLHNSIDRFLFSFGTGLNYKTQKISPKHSERIAKTIDFMRSTKFMDDCTLYIDSGGFQVAMGAIKPESMPMFIEMYSKFLVSNKDKFQRAFSLDLPPGPNSSVFKSYSQIEELNRLSYNTFKQLPQEVKDKVLYIHHFRTPSLYKTWRKFLFEEGMAEGMSNFATGGIVANSSTDIAIPVIIYTIPLSEILLYAIQNNIKKFDFHVLGGANYIDIFYHNLFSYHIKKRYDIDCNITYDSSAIFKGLAVGRFIPMFKSNGELHKMDLRSAYLHLKFDGSKTREECVFERLNFMAKGYGMKELDPQKYPIYDVERDTFSREVHMWLMMHIMRMYRELEMYCQDYIKEIYPLYENGKIEEFDDACLEISRKFNEGKLSRKMQVKSCSVYKSLELLSNINIDYNKYIIDKFMAGDDIGDMDDNTQIEM